MSDAIIARRYAQALIEQAAEAAATDAVDGDIDLVRRALEESRNLTLCFDSPVISREKKAAVVRALFGERVSSVTLNFLLFVIEKQRERLFQVVAAEYGALRDRERGIVNVFVRVAGDLNEPGTSRLKSSLETMIGDRVRMTTERDPSLLGGLVVRVGDTLYDGSVSNGLRSLRSRFEQN